MHVFSQRERFSSWKGVVGLNSLIGFSGVSTISIGCQRKDSWPRFRSFRVTHPVRCVTR